MRRGTVADYLQAFLRYDPPPFGELELLLTAPQRGHTCALEWLVADGACVTAGQALFRQQSDTDPQDERSFASPVPGRVRILTPSGRFLSPGPVGRLTYGYALEAALHQEWEELALDLAAELGKRQKATPVPGLAPHDLLQLVYLDYALCRKLEQAGVRKPAAVIPADLREDRALAALGELTGAKIAAIRAASDLPAAVIDHTVLLWKNLHANMAATLRHDGLAADDGLTPD